MSAKSKTEVFRGNSELLTLNSQSHGWAPWDASDINIFAYVLNKSSRANRRVNSCSEGTCRHSSVNTYAPSTTN